MMIVLNDCHVERVNGLVRSNSCLTIQKKIAGGCNSLAPVDFSLFSKLKSPFKGEYSRRRIFYMLPAVEVPLEGMCDKVGGVL